MKLTCFDDFCDALLECGFSMGGGNSKGIYAVVDFGWETQDGIDSPIKWHTGDPETDPWEWRMRVLEERDDIAYAKLFFRASGFITAEWYPRFLAVRRRGESANEAYRNGRMSHEAKLVYDIVAESSGIPYHELRANAASDSARFAQAILELQTGMFVTICGRAFRTGRDGENYGWNSTAFATVEDFWRQRGVELDEEDPDEAYDLIRERILQLNPGADERKIRKFIRG